MVQNALALVPEITAIIDYVFHVQTLSHNCYLHTKSFHICRNVMKTMARDGHSINVCGYYIF